MFCCETKQSIPDTASDRKRTALEDARKKGVLVNFYVLTRCSNPYAIGDIVLISDQRNVSIYQCGDLVFQMIDYDLKKYICGDWVGKLAREAKALKTQQEMAKTRDRTQSYKNAAAAKNYVFC